MLDQMGHQLSIALPISGVLLVSACGSESTVPLLPTAPTATTAATAAVAVRGLSISGKVFDTGHRPLPGARVEVLNGIDAGLSTTADARGQYWLTGSFDGDTLFRATLEGYREGVAPLPAPCARCNPQHWVYFYLGLPVAPADIAGRYDVTVIADASCSMLPREMRTRTYTATIVAKPKQPTPDDTRFVARIEGRSVLPGLGAPDVAIAVAGDYLELSMGDLHGQPGVVERVYDNGFFAFGGWGSTNVGAGPVSTITSTFEGSIEYCVLPPGMSPIAEARYACARPYADTHAVCQARGHQLMLKRQ
jgi:hypothetical protein